MDYQKRLGTSGVEGQLYETKVIALMMLRLLHDERVADFRLATNMEGMGAFDDICVRVSVVGREQALALFIQLKHKIHDDATLKIYDNNTDLVKYMDSFVSITKKIASKTHSMFILYTNAEFKVPYSALQTEDNQTKDKQTKYTFKRFVCTYDNLSNDLLVTGASVGQELGHNKEMVQNFAKIKFQEDLTGLAERLAMFLCDETKREHMMNDKHLQQYHVVLAKHVVHVGDIQTDNIGTTTWRKLSFRNEFFESQDIPVKLFRCEFFKQILKKLPKIVRRGTDSTATEASVDDLIASFLLLGTAAALSPLITTYIASDDAGTLQFLVDRPATDVEQLSQMKVSTETTAEAYLRSLRINVPDGFGNVDMMMSGGAKKVEKRFKYLVTGIFDMCQRHKQVESLKVVTIDETVDGGLLTHCGGLASGVGNLLTWDESTDMLRFADQFTCRQTNAETLFAKLKVKIEQQSFGTDHLSDYRFKVKTSKLPKLSFDCTDTAREFISKLVIYDKQRNQSKVEELLKDEIQNLLYKKAHNSALQCHSVFLHYHDEVVSWWLRPSGTYLNKASNLYELAINNIKAEPQISALHTTFHVNNSKYCAYSFDETTPKWLALEKLPTHMSIVTNTVTLTTMQAIQCLRKMRTLSKYAVVDMESVARLSTADFCSFQEELRKTKKLLFIAWRDTDSGAVSSTMLNELAQATECKQIVVVTNNVEKKIYEYFAHIEVFRDETLKFTSMSAESQKELRKKCIVIFQGVSLSLDDLMDDVSLSFVKGVVLDKLTRHEAISLGAALGDPRYEEIKHLYIDRNVCWVSNDGNDELNARCLVRTFHDIADDVVLLTAPPGMGKSTLLTRLSINTKEQDRTLWIVRVNFINHSKKFQEWCDDDTRVGAVEALEFLCRAVISDEEVAFSVQLKNDKAFLVNCAADEFITFELNMFLHYCNMQRLIYIFDGFDEICPHYKDKVVDFLIVVKTRLMKNKMWVTSRPYSDILPDLQRALGGGFQMEHLSYREQESFLKRFWREKSINEKLCKQLESLETFIDNASQSISEVHDWVQFIYYNFVDVVRQMLGQSRHADVEGYLEHFWIKPVEDAMSGIPLILYFMADYFVHIVDNYKKMGCDRKRTKSKLTINLHDVYKMFVENKVKKILSQDKNNMELSNPITRGMIERELLDRTSVYKKLAANALLKYYIFNPLYFEEFKAMTPLDNEELCKELYRIKTGADKTGLISHVTEDNVVVFIHRSFTEYFAAEYACDILQSQKFKKSIKVLWYCAFTWYSNQAVRDWIESKKKYDKTLENVFKEIEEPSPIYATDIRNYLVQGNLKSEQFIRILASSVDDYDGISFKTFSDVFTSSYLKTLDAVTCETVSQYLVNHLINQMKVHLREHFANEALFVLINNTFDRFNTDPYSAHNIRLKIEIVGQKGAIPTLLQLEHKGDNDAINFDDSGLETNNKIDSQADDTCKSLLHIVYVNDEFTMGSYTTREPDSVRVFDTFMATTGTARGRLQYSEQQVQEFANILPKKEISLFVEYLASILTQKKYYNTSSGRDMHCLQQYRYCEFLEEKPDVNNPDRLILMFRDDFLYTNDTYTTQLRNYLIEEILRQPAINLPEIITGDELITSFLSAPSTATLTPLIGTFIVCCEEGKLKFAIHRPAYDRERLKRVKMQDSEIDEALGAVKIAVIEYLRSLRLKVPVNSADIDMMLDRNVEETVDAILELCERCDRTDLYKVVTIDETKYDLTHALGSVLTFDEQSAMLKFLNKYTAAQKNAKLLFEKVSDRINDLHKYRFQIKYKKFSELHANCDATAREFLDNLVIYGKRGNHYRVENIFLGRQGHVRNEIHTIVSQLSLLHCHSEIVKWWTSPSTSQNLTAGMSPGGDGRCSATRDLYRRTVYNVTREPLISELHTIFHRSYFKYFENSYYKRSSKWQKLLEIPCRTLIETDAVTVTTIEVVQFLRNNGSLNKFTILELNYVFVILSDTNDRRLLFAELRQTDKVLIVVWHTTRPDAGERTALCEFAEAMKEKNVIIVTNNKFREYRHLLGTNRVFNCKSELWSAA